MSLSLRATLLKEAQEQDKMKNKFRKVEKRELKSIARLTSFRAANEISTMKLIVLSLIVLLTILTTLSYASAIGITPGKRTLDYTSGMTQEVSFRVVNTEYKDMTVHLYKEGTLAPFIEFQEQTVHFDEDEESKTFRYTFRVNSLDLKGGSYEGRIVAVEVPEAQSGQISAAAVLGVATQVVLRVPYPGEYIEATLDVNEVEPGKNITFVVGATNLGSKQTKVSAQIDILRGSEIVGRIKSNEIIIQPQQRNALRAEWPAVESGVYTARATVNYDGNKKTTVSKEFRISGLMLEIKRIFVKNYRLNEIAKVAIVVESKWNDIIKDVYGHLTVTSDKGDTVGDFKSASVDMQPKAVETIYAYWDTEGVEKGVYDGKIVLHYEDNQIEKILKAKIDVDSMEIEVLGLSAQVIGTARPSGNISTILIIVVIVLVLVNFAWFFYFRRQKSGNKITQASSQSSTSQT